VIAMSGPGGQPPAAKLPVEALVRHRYDAHIRARLRETVTTIAQEIARRPGQLGLLAAVADLVEELDLGPAPDLRECPVCKGLGRGDATRCSHCWTELTPPAERDGVPA